MVTFILLLPLTPTSDRIVTLCALRSVDQHSYSISCKPFYNFSSVAPCSHSGPLIYFLRPFPTTGQGINLDDIFSGVLFTPDGELLDIPSDDDENLNITLSTTRISEGRTQTSFGQFAVVGDTLASEESGSSGQFQDVLISPGTVKIEQVVDSESGSPSAGPLPESGHFQVPSSVGGGPVLAGGFTAEGATVVGTAQSNSKDSSVDRCSGVEDADASAAFALAADAAAAAAVAAAEARAAQDAAVAKAEVAAKAAEAHAQVKTISSSFSMVPRGHSIFVVAINVLDPTVAKVGTRCIFFILGVEMAPIVRGQRHVFALYPTSPSEPFYRF